MLRQALKDAWPAVRKFGWRFELLCELQPQDKDVGYTSEDGTLFVKVRDPATGSSDFYSYSFVLATLLHELTHLSVLGHGKAFYKRLKEAAGLCGAAPRIRSEVLAHVCGELLNAVCDNDARRAKALLAILPEAVACKRPDFSGQLPLDYAAHHGRVALTKLLLAARANADATSEAGGLPPLARAAAMGNSKTARVLLQAGASWDAVKALGSHARPASEEAPTGASEKFLGLLQDEVFRKKRPSSLPARSLSLPMLPARRARRGIVLCGSLAL